MRIEIVDVADGSGGLLGQAHASPLSFADGTAEYIGCDRADGLSGEFPGCCPEVQLSETPVV